MSGARRSASARRAHDDQRRRALSGKIIEGNNVDIFYGKASGDASASGSHQSPMLTLEFGGKVAGDKIAGTVASSVAWPFRRTRIAPFGSLGSRTFVERDATGGPAVAYGIIHGTNLA
jgi:hypothetical protein